MVKRYLSDKNLNRVIRDFSFLIKLINESHGEYDFSIRDDYFNLYYKGNSMAKVSFLNGDNYLISIHKKFFEKTSAEDPKFYLTKKQNKDYWNVELSNKEIHPFLQKKHLNEFASRIKEIHYGEEIVFEQAIITDNLNNPEIIIIDRQITDSGLQRKRMDLLALKRVENLKYTFLILEVKLGNNPELKGKVATQLNTYITHIQNHFQTYKESYENQYRQKVKLGLFSPPFSKNIEIVPPVDGLIVVGGYSGIAVKSIKELEAKHPSLNLKHFKYAL